MRRPLACGQLCRAPPGELPRGRRSLAAGAISTNGGVFALRRHAGEQRCAARWPAASCADRRSAFPGGRGHLHEWRCLCLAASSGGAAIRRPLACGQLCRAPPGELPGGRRSLAAGAICTNGGVFALRRHPGEQRFAARWPAASCADRRSAFPGGWCHLHEWRCLCPAASCGGAAMRRPLACGQLCRAPPGELPRGRRSPAAGAICTNGGVFALPRHAAEQRCAARWPAASCAGPHRENCPEVGVPSRPRAFLAWWRTAERAKNNGSELRSLPA